MKTLLAVLLLTLGCNTPPPHEDIATRIKRECASLVDLAHRDKDDDQTVDTNALVAELKRRGVETPTRPERPKFDDWKSKTDKEFEKEMAKFRESEKKFEDAKKAYDAAWEQLRSSHPKYQGAWEAVWIETMKSEVHECVTLRLAKEGISR